MTALLLLALLTWALIGMAVVHRIQPALARIALLVLLSVLAWPITLLGARFRRSRFSITHRPDPEA